MAAKLFWGVVTSNQCGQISAITTDAILGFMIGELAAYKRGSRVCALELKAIRAVTGSITNSPITSGKYQINQNIPLGG
jgi:hypothetical protein